MSIELIEAVSTGNYELVSKLILGGAKVNYTGYNNTTPLIEASKNGNKDIVQLLIQANANVQATDNNSMNALMYAIFLKNTDAVLLESELSLTDISSTKYPFQRNVNYSVISKSQDSTDILEALLEAGTEINTIDANKKTVLIHATSQGNLEAVKIILKYNPNINHIDGCGSNALSYASRFNNTEIASELIEEGIDINFEDELESTPLIYANMLQNEELIKILLSKGAQLNTNLQMLVQMLGNIKIQTMINTAKYVDFLLDNSLETFDNLGEIDSSILTSRYEFLLNTIQIDFEDLHLKLQKLNSSSLNQEEKHQLKIIFEHLIFQCDSNSEDEVHLISDDNQNNFLGDENNVNISDFLDPTEEENMLDIFDQMDEYCEHVINNFYH